MSEGKVQHRGAITVCVMLATLMQALDTTIANVALPYMQGSLSASQDQINWVLTSYIVMAAIMTPPTGWLAARFGRTRLFLICVAGFTVASALCGLSSSLAEIVLSRMLQGAFGAALVPLSQAVLLDIYPKEKQGAAMGLWGVGVMVGPIIGPTVGGWLTDNYNWGSVFYINLPVGVLAWVGLRMFLTETKQDSKSGFDWFGFTSLSVGLGAIQLMLDRGEQLDWFGSTEIIAETCIGVLGFYFFAVHLWSAKAPFISPRLFKDRNFSTGVISMFMLGIIMLATMALLTPFLQNLMAYPVTTAGMVMSPRGAGTMVSMMVAGRLVGKVDARIPILIGLGLTIHALYLMTGFTTDVSIPTIITTGIEQGFGMGMVFVPMSTMTFATLDPSLRTEGTGVFALARNIGGAIGISIAMTLLQTHLQENHAEISAYATPFNPLFQPGMPGHALDPETGRAAAMLDVQIQQQSAIIAYIDDYKLMMWIAILAIPMVLLMRMPKRSPGRAEPAMAID